jgi:hypothetical protein
MKTPKKRHPVKQDMLRIYREVEKDKGHNPGGQGRHLQYIENSPSTPFACERHSDCGCGEQDPYDQIIEKGYKKIAGPPAAFWRGERASWCEQFPDAHKDKNTKETPEAYSEFVIDNEHIHNS